MSWTAVSRLIGVALEVTVFWTYVAGVFCVVVQRTPGDCVRSWLCNEPA